MIFEYSILDVLKLSENWEQNGTKHFLDGDETEIDLTAVVQLDHSKAVEMIGNVLYRR